MLACERQVVQEVIFLDIGVGDKSLTVKHETTVPTAPPGEIKMIVGDDI
jgi:hypothetical protein